MRIKCHEYHNCDFTRSNRNMVGDYGLVREMTPQEEQAYQKWLNSFSDYMKPEDGQLFVIRTPSDMDKVYDMLETMEI